MAPLFKKGDRLTPERQRALAAAGVTSVVTARLELETSARTRRRLSSPSV